MSLKNSNDTIRNRTHDLPVCSVVQCCLVFVNKYIECLSSLCTKKGQSEDNSNLTSVSIRERRSGLHSVDMCNNNM